MNRSNKLPLDSCGASRHQNETKYKIILTIIQQDYFVQKSLEEPGGGNFLS